MQVGDERKAQTYLLSLRTLRAVHGDQTARHRKAVPGPGMAACIGRPNDIILKAWQTFLCVTFQKTCTPPFSVEPSSEGSRFSSICRANSNDWRTSRQSMRSWIGLSAVVAAGWAWARRLRTLPMSGHGFDRRRRVRLGQRHRRRRAPREASADRDSIGGRSGRS